jgi:transcriptional regulator with XRE-family HTH domain
MTRPPGVRRLLVGSALRRHRENSGLALADAARILECDKSKISRIETGERGITRTELRALLAEYGAIRPEADILAALAGRGDCWPQYRDLLPAPARDLLALELAATEITIYSPQQIPALLQTPGYASTLADTTIPADERDPHADLILSHRDAILDRHKTTVNVITGRAALRSAPRDIMRDQARYLATAIARYPHLALQILPLSSCAAAAGSGPVTLLRLGSATAAVYLPGLTGGAFLTGDTDIAAHAAAFARLREAALIPDASARLLREISNRRPPRS